MNRSCYNILFFCRRFTGYRDGLQSILSCLFRSCDSTGIVPFIYRNVNRILRIASFAVNLLNFVNFLGHVFIVQLFNCTAYRFDLLCMLLLAGGGMSILASKYQHFVFPIGVS